MRLELLFLPTLIAAVSVKAGGMGNTIVELVVTRADVPSKETLASESTVSSFSLFPVRIRRREEGC